MHYFFTSFLPYKLPSQTLMFIWWVCIAQITLPLQITNVSSYFIISHSVKAKNLFWEVEWVVFHSVSNNIKVKKKKKKCCTVWSPPPNQDLFSSDVGFQLWALVNWTIPAFDNRESCYFPVCRPFVPKVFLLYCTNYGLYIFLYIMSYFIISK